jgi:gas vesicle protein
VWCEKGEIFAATVTQQEANDMERAQIGNFLIGVGMGAAMAMLFAPSSGNKTRARINKAASEGTTYVREHGETVRDTMLGVVDQIARHKEAVAEAIKRGSEAYRRTVS